VCFSEGFDFGVWLVIKCDHGEAIVGLLILAYSPRLHCVTDKKADIGCQSTE